MRGKSKTNQLSIADVKLFFFASNPVGKAFPVGPTVPPPLPVTTLGSDCCPHEDKKQEVPASLAGANYISTVAAGMEMGFFQNWVTHAANVAPQNSRRL